MRKPIALGMAVLLILAAMACGASDEDLQAEYDRGYAAGETAAMAMEAGEADSALQWLWVSGA